MAVSCAQEAVNPCDAPDHGWTASEASADYVHVGAVPAAAAALLAAEASCQMAMVVALLAHECSG